jgi:23S rRNA (uracil1939-C5)-methyltransferase
MRLNRLAAEQIVPIAARVEDALARVSKSKWDAVVLDPPRDGCAPGVLQTIVDRIAPLRVVYVSCNPEALAGELPILLTAGYRIDQVVGVDMFPHTDHIEAVVTLSHLPKSKP